MTIFILIIAIIIVILYYKRTIPEISQKQKIFLTFLRSISIIILIILLFNPILNFTKEFEKKSIHVILNDTSLSMTKTDSIKTELSKIADNIEKKYLKFDYRVENLNFANGIEGDLQNTNLTKSLNDIGKNYDISDIESITLISDGWFADDNFDILENYNFRINCVTKDYKIEYSDLEITNVDHNKTAYTDEIFPLSIDIYSNNYQGKAKLLFSVREKIISEKEVDFSQENYQQINFEHKFENEGLYPINFKLVPTEEIFETNSVNNSFPLAIDVMKSKSEFLIITDQLNWDVKFINNVIKTNKRWKSQVLTLKKENLYKNGERVILRNMITDKLKTIIISSQNKTEFSSTMTALINNFVEKGGGLVFFGKPDNSLSSILPISPSNIPQDFKGQFTLTETANKYNSFNQLDKNTLYNIPEIKYFYVSAKLEAEILAHINNSEKSPAIIYNNKKNGKVLALAFNNLWRWQLWIEDSDYQNFINSILAWMRNRAQDNFMAYPKKNSFFSGEMVSIFLNAYDERMQFQENLNAKITIRDSSSKKVESGFMKKANKKYKYEINRLLPGKYTFKVTDSQRNRTTDGNFIVNESSTELRHFGFNETVLNYISENTGGKMLLADKTKDFKPTPAISKSVVQDIEIPLYKKYYFILAFLIAFLLEIFLRKRWGLL